MDVEQVLDRGGVTQFHWRAVTQLGLALTFTGANFFAISYALPRFREIWVMPEWLLSLLGTSAVIGSFFGSAGAGVLADRWGRKPVFNATVAMAALFGLLSAVAWGPWSLILFRFIAGLGLGGIMVAGTSLVAEYLPPQVRGRFMVIYDLFWPLGGLVSWSIGYLVLEQMGSWRLLFLAASAWGLLLPLGIRESPFYLARSGRLQQAEQVLQHITRVSAKGLLQSERVQTEAQPIARLFQGRMAISTSVLILAWSALAFATYGYFIWLPEAMSTLKGIIVGSTYGFLLLSVLAQFPGYLLAGWLIDTWGRKKTVGAFMLLGALAGYIFGMASTYIAFVAGLFLVSFFVLGSWASIYAYAPELFPTRLRSRGLGVTQAVGRIAAIIGSLLFGYLQLATDSTLLPLAIVGTLLAAGGIAVLLWSPETKGVPFV